MKKKIALGIFSGVLSACLFLNYYEANAQINHHKKANGKCKGSAINCRSTVELQETY